MDVVVPLVVSLGVVGVLLSVAALVSATLQLRRAPDDSGVRFGAGWQGAYALLMGPTCCVMVVGGLAQQVRTSWLALLTVILMNVLAQPVWLLMAFAGFRKIVLGLTGRMGYAWRAVPEEELGDLPPGERRSLQLYCIVQGLVILPLGGFMSLACAVPLLSAFVD